MANRLKTATLSLRIDPDLKRAAEKAADADQRSLTSLIEKLLADYVKENGPKAKPRK
jgi:predicted HicB family RNase H-like nuclease